MKRLSSCLRLLLIVAVVLLPSPAPGQQAVDLFSDQMALNPNFVRVGAWNLRHIDLEPGAREFLPGANDDEDFAILIAMFAKAILDLGLDLVAIVEFQPRTGEPNRLLQIRDRLNANPNGPWRADETHIPYDNPSDPAGNLQFGLLWNSTRVTINSAANTLLSDLRQPRNASGNLTEQTRRIPWLVPVKVGNLEFDLLVLHLKSGGEFPQAREVDALQQFITQRQSALAPRHLIVCGDWNIRPDQSEGRAHLRQMSAPGPGGNLMHILTVEEIKPTLAQWETLGSVSAGTPLAALVPFSHFNNQGAIDTLLDHIAISRTLDEIFDNPVQVTLPNGAMDLQPGVRIVLPLIPEDSYLKLTDHLPIVLTLRTTSAVPPPPPSPPGNGLRIVGAVPNPPGEDSQDEEVRLQNAGNQPVSLAGWRIGDSTGNSFWNLTASDGTVPAGAVVIVKRLGRAMTLNNSTSDMIVLISPSGTIVDQKSYPGASSGQLITFN